MTDSNLRLGLGRSRLAISRHRLSFGTSPCTLSVGLGGSHAGHELGLLVGVDQQALPQLDLQQPCTLSVCLGGSHAGLELRLLVNDEQQALPQPSQQPAPQTLQVTALSRRRLSFDTSASLLACSLTA